MIWEPETQQNIELLLQSTDNKTIQVLQSKIYSTLLEMVSIVSNKKGLCLDDDDKIIIITSVYSKVIPSIDWSRVKASQQYIYTSICNLSVNRYVHNKIKRNKLHNEITRPLSQYSDNYNNNIDYVVQRIAMNGDDWLVE